MLNFKEAIIEPYSRGSRATIGITLLLIPYLNLIGAIVLLGHAIVNAGKTESRFSQPLDLFLKGIGALLIAILIALPLLGTYSLWVWLAEPTITPALTLSLVFIALHGYITLALWKQYAKTEPLTGSWILESLRRIGRGEYLLAWLLIMLTNTAGYVIIQIATDVIYQLLAQLPLDNAAVTIVIPLAVVMILTAVIGYTQIIISAALLRQIQ